MKRKKDARKKRSSEVLLLDEVFSIHRKKGNGIIRRQVWVNSVEEVTRYSLAYINHRLFHGDNGRVLGYDNAHGYHHKHYMGKVEPIAFISFEKVEKKFQSEFEVLHAEAKKVK